MATDPLYRRSGDVLWRSTPTGLWLRPLGGETLTVAAPGDAVWVLLEEPATLDDLVRALADHFGEQVERIRGDVETLLADLVARGVVRVDP
ncbi:MAG: PqqD family protein [Acidimicrobiales bacterium]